MNGMSMVNRWGRLGMRNLTEAALDVANIIEWQRHTYLPRTREIVGRLPLVHTTGTGLGCCPYCHTDVGLRQASCSACQGQFTSPAGNEV
jgi:hypothetical protein